MLGKENVISKMSSTLLASMNKQDVSDFVKYIDSNWDEIEEACYDVIRRLPDIGFCSRAKRLSAFYVACEILEKKYENNDIDSNGVMAVFSILRLYNTPFKKAIIMFELMVEQRRVQLGGLPSDGLSIILMYKNAMYPNA